MSDRWYELCIHCQFNTCKQASTPGSVNTFITWINHLHQRYLLFQIKVNTIPQRSLHKSLFSPSHPCPLMQFSHPITSKHFLFCNLNSRYHLKVTHTSSSKCNCLSDLLGHFFDESSLSSGVTRRDDVINECVGHTCCPSEHVPTYRAHVLSVRTHAAYCLLPHTHGDVTGPTRSMPVRPFHARIFSHVPSVRKQIKMNMMLFAAETSSLDSWQHGNTRWGLAMQKTSKMNHLVTHGTTSLPEARWDWLLEDRGLWLVELFQRARGCSPSMERS